MSNTDADLNDLMLALADSPPPQSPLPAPVEEYPYELDGPQEPEHPGELLEPAAHAVKKPGGQAQIQTPEPAPTPAPVQTAAPASPPSPESRARTAATLSRETSALDRLSDFRSPYAAAYLEVLESQEAVELAKAQVIEAEARIGEGLQDMVTRVEQLLERADRVQNSITLSIDMLGQQAKLIASAFRDQLTAGEMDGLATLKTHMLELADEVANKSTAALNQVADEAAAFAGVKAENAALERVTSVVMDQAKQAGLEKSVLALANVVSRLQLAVERIEQAPAQAPHQQAQQQSQQGPAQPRAPEGLGAHRHVTIWLAHHLGTPGILIALAGLGLLGWRFFS